MPFPASIMNLGAPRNATPEVMAVLRAEKAMHVALFEAKKHRRGLELANYSESHPESIQVAMAHVVKFLASSSHVRVHWILERWRLILETLTHHQIVAFLRDESEETKIIRHSPPYFGPRDR